MTNPIRKIFRAFRHERQMKREPLRLEFVVTDTCNLNCKGCTHYSPLAPREFEPIGRLESTIRQLAQKCGRAVESAYLIGGETLLYPDLEKAMAVLRECFPTQKLCIYTNGLLLPKMADSFWEKASELNFTIEITRYPVKFDYDGVIELCRQKGVECNVFGDRSLANSFFRFALDPAKGQNAALSHLRCYNRGCISVIGEKIYPCPISGCIEHLNRSKGTDFKHCKGDFLLVDEIRGADQIRRLRDRPVPFCSYCKLPPAVVKYGPSKREASEWVDMSD